METLNFSEFDRERLEDTFNLKKVRKSEVLQNWISSIEKYSLDEFETRYLLQMQDVLIDRADTWNEIELIERFVAPVFSLVNFNTDVYSMFSEREIKAIVDGIELKGKPDAIVAKGFYSPKIPYFCFNEYKKEDETKGDAKGQCLAAMLAAQELNNKEHPIYGVVVKGKMWEFLVLKGKEYAISKSYNSTDEELFEIVKLLKHLKTIIDEYVKS